MPRILNAHKVIFSIHSLISKLLGEFSILFLKSINTLSSSFNRLLILLFFIFPMAGASVVICYKHCKGKRDYQVEVIKLNFNGWKTVFYLDTVLVDEEVHCLIDSPTLLKLNLFFFYYFFFIFIEGSKICMLLSERLLYLSLKLLETIYYEWFWYRFQVICILRIHFICLLYIILWLYLVRKMAQGVKGLPNDFINFYSVSLYYT